MTDNKQARSEMIECPECGYGSDEYFDRIEGETESSTDELINLLKEAAVQWASIGRLLALRSNNGGGNIARTIEDIKQTFREYGEEEWVKQIRW